jgi:ABC-2 type transport system ATP-binding protein
VSGSATALTIRGLHKSYGDVRAVTSLDLSVSSGECFGLLGPNGAGKTTTLEICEGLLEPDGGEVEVLGMRWPSNAQELRERLGIALQETQLSEKLSVNETVTLFRSFYRKGRPVDEVIRLVQSSAAPPSVFRRDSDPEQSPPFRWRCSRTTTAQH